MDEKQIERMKAGMRPDLKKRISRWDEWCREVFSDKRVIAYILREYFPEFKDCSVDEIERLLENNERTSADGSVKSKSKLTDTAVSEDSVMPKIAGLDPNFKSTDHGNIICDLKFYATYPKSGERFIVMMDFQNSEPSNYKIPNRMQYYGSAGIYCQKQQEFEKSNYDSLKDVAVLWIVRKYKSHRKSSVRLVKNKAYDLVGHDDSFSEDDFGKLKYYIIVFGDYENEPSGSCTRLICIILSAKLSRAEKAKMLEEEYGIKDILLKGEEDGMCSFGESIYFEGVEDGIEKGFTNGKTEGIEIGKTEGIEIGKAARDSEWLKKLGLMFRGLKEQSGIEQAEKAISMFNLSSEEMNIVKQYT